MARNVIETIMGAVVLLVAAGFLMFVFKQSAVRDIDGYTIGALFTDVSGIGVGSDVRIGGMKVGIVKDMELDAETYQARAILEIRDNVKIPKDSSAAVVSNGLLGEKFIKLEPGGDDKILESGGTIRFTQSSISFEELIGKFVFSGGGVASDDQAPAAPNAATTAPNPAKEEKDNPFSLGF